MSDSARFQFAYLAAAQAQKHVTVNEALARIDALAAGRVESFGTTTPPAAPADGDLHVIGVGGTGDWAGQDGALALFSNGGWVFVPPWAGARIWDAGEGVERLFTGAAWVETAAGTGAASVSAPGGATTLVEILEVDHLLAAGASSTVTAAIPDKAIVFGVTGRVTEAIAGATGWQLGVAGAADRYGAGLGAALNSYAHGVSGAPVAYYADTDLLITAEGGSFSGGRVALAVHLMRLVPPGTV